jgi:hypothetical protein
MILQQILVERGLLVGEQLVEVLDDLGIAFHRKLPADEFRTLPKWAAPAPPSRAPARPGSFERAPGIHWF